MRDSVTWKIGGEAGFGIMSSGIMLARAFSRLGYFTFATNDYPSLIRGGHNVITVRIAKDQFGAMNRDLHVLVALNKQTIDLHKDELKEGSVVFYDPNDIKASEFPQNITLVAIPFREIVSKVGGEPVMRNTVALGATIALLGAPFEALSTVITDQFKKKGEEVIKQNIDLAKAGFDAAKPNEALKLSAAQKKEDQLLINASEAIGLGAARAGLKFAAIYPMTPINSLITFLADHAKTLNLVYKQPEDELAGINMAIGASLGGARSMVATSGGGFALMNEGLSWAGIIEAPLVIDLGMRVGPSTGMPTYTEQGELLYAIHAGHGEFPRIVLAPADASEAYQFTVDAFNLADRYQVPVFIMSDKYLNESTWCAPKSVFTKEVVIDRGKVLGTNTSGEFKRYDLNVEDGISPRSFVGQKGGFYYANSYEHDEIGHVTDDAKARVAMATKRLKKFKAMEKDMMAPMVYGEEDAEITFITWGSTRGAVVDALKLIQKKARLIHFPWIFPFPVEQTMKLLAPSTRIIDVEQNATGQLASLIREQTGILIKEKILKFDGRPLLPEEIRDYVSNT